MHFKQRIRTTKYPVQRATDLVYVISEDLESVLLRLLSKHGLMHLEYVLPHFSPSCVSHVCCLV
jgi:hypothetical protein